MKGDKDDYMEENVEWIAGHKTQGCGRPINPVLGICLEGNAAFLKPYGEKLISVPVLTEMQHDLEEGVTIYEEGKK